MTLETAVKTQYPHGLRNYGFAAGFAKPAKVFDAVHLWPDSAPLGYAGPLSSDFCARSLHNLPDSPQYAPCAAISGLFPSEHGLYPDEHTAYPYEYIPRSGEYTTRSGEYAARSGEYAAYSDEYAAYSGEYAVYSGEYSTHSGEYVTHSGEYVTHSGEYAARSGEYTTHSDGFIVTRGDSALDIYRSEVKDV